MSAPAFGSIGTLFGSTTSTPAFAVPASVASGDIIVVAFFSDVSTTTISSFPTGFAEAENSPRTVNAGGFDNHAIHVAWKRATGNDTGTYSFTLSASVFVYGNAVRYTGCVASGNPWDSPTNAADGGSTAGTSCPDVSVTTAGPDRMLFYVGTNFNGDAGTWTAPTSFSQRQGGASVTNCEISDLVQATQGGSGNVHATNTASGRLGSWLGALIGTTVAGGVPYTPPRYPQFRDPGETWWIQKDRRDANLVGSAANPLVSPLDSAWQADGPYWHLYNDSAGRDRRLVPQQRPYVSDPNLLAPGVTDPLGMPTGPAYRAAAYWDRRETVPQRAYRSDPPLLDTALLENELLGGADDQRRHYAAAGYYDRREVPQQRAYTSVPGQLDTALLENELLGGAETAKRANVPATHAPRWWMPQQPDRETLYFDAGPGSPPLTLAWGDGGTYWATYNQAGWQPDRREVPQQRLYISDPSFYPTVPPTDPLTVAWGAGGHYWLIYSAAALFVDRREVPQQRRYVSDPGLLATALLENELLGGADAWRHLTAALFVDRRQTAFQLRWPDPTLLTGTPADPLLVGAGVGGDRWRRYHTPAYWDRREVPVWRLYVSDPSAYPVPPATAPGYLTAMTSAAGQGISTTASGAATATTRAGYMNPTSAGGG